MNKDEILEKSRNENKNADPYELEVTTKAHSYGLWSMLILLVILTAVKLFKGQGFDYSLLSALWVFNSAEYIYKAAKQKEKKFVTAAAAYTFAAVVWTGIAVAQILMG